MVQPVAPSFPVQHPVEHPRTLTERFVGKPRHFGDTFDSEDEETRWLLDRGPQRRPKEYKSTQWMDRGVLIERLQRSTDRVRTRGILKRLRPFQTGTEAAAAITALTKTVSPSMGLKVMEEELKNDDELRTAAVYSAAIAACGRGGFADRALELLEEMTSTRRQIPNVYAYSSAMAALSKHGRWREARDLLIHDMRRQKVEPNIVCYGAVLAACSRAGEWKAARNLLGIMYKRNVEPNAVAYKMVIDVCEREHAWDPLLTTYDEMRQRTNVKKEEEEHPLPPPPPGRRRQPDDGVLIDGRTYSGAMTASYETQRWERVVDIFDTFKTAMGSRNLNTAHYEMAIGALARLQRSVDALDLCAEMRTRWRRPVSIDVYRLLLENCDDDLGPVLADVLHDGLHHKLASDAIKACDRIGNTHRAVDILRSLRPKDPSDLVTAYFHVSKACYRHGDWRKVLVLYDELLPSLMNNSTLQLPDIVGLAILAAEFGGQWPRAEAIFRDAHRRWGIFPSSPTRTAARFRVSLFPDANPLDPSQRTTD